LGVEERGAIRIFPFLGLTSSVDMTNTHCWGVTLLPVAGEGKFSAVVS